MSGKTVTLSAKKYKNIDTVPFVGHELDSTGINMSQKRVHNKFRETNHPHRIILFSGTGQLFPGSYNTTLLCCALSP